MKMFGNDFKWGVSTSAFQIEGAYNADGKGASIWDKFCEKKRRIFAGHNGHVACDFYNRYADDISLMKELHIPNFRFSLSWPRLIPSGTGKPNQKGIDFYNRVIDQCLEKEIEPWVTLYHWDLPDKLELKGGWANRDILYWFDQYAELCLRKFGDRVKYWMSLNEPMVFTGAGYFLGVHAPGKTGLKNFLPALHHAAICQAQGIRIAKSFSKAIQAGTTLSCSHIDPYSNRPSDTRAAQRIDTLLNRVFIEPLLGMGYPQEDLKLLNRLQEYMKPDDDKLLQAEPDFIGIQNYTREVAKHSWFTPLLRAKLIPPRKRKAPVTAMNWEIYPQAIYHILKKYAQYPGMPGLYITENGAAFNDVVSPDGKVHDEERVQYLKDHLAQVMRAKQEGVNVQGYFVWSLLDNFEWAEGYYPCFGLVHVDYKTKKRTIKSSGRWYSEFIAKQTVENLLSVLA